MRIDNIEIKNFKSFKDKYVEFNGMFSLVIGDNGTGKTSILEALSIGLGGFLAGLDGVESRNFLSDEVRMRTIKQGDATVTIEPQFPCEVACRGIVNDRYFAWARSVNKREGRTTRIHAKDIMDYASELQKAITQESNQEIILPLISYQSAARLFSQKREKWTNPFEKTKLSRFMGYTDCLDAESNIKLFVNWLRKMTMIKLQKNKDIGELNATLTAVETFMYGLVEVGQKVTVEYDFESDEVVVRSAGHQIPLRLMSSGYRSVIGMVADLAFRMAILNPHLKERAVLETPGIVLIDELDLHLHPKWQWKIVEDLKRTFPKVQFIVTTHAPIIMASCKEGEIIKLDDTEKVINNTYGWLVEDILENVMDSQSRVPAINKKIEQIEALYLKRLNSEINNVEREQLRELEKELKLILPEEDPAVTLAKLNAMQNKLRDGEDDEES